jgi:hypothetical protein
MIWTKRILLALPFAVAALLTVLVSLADRLGLNLERVAGYGFLFATPWAWLLDRGRFGAPLISYAVILWIPALLYSCCMWLLFQGIAFWMRRDSR